MTLENIYINNIEQIFTERQYLHMNGHYDMQFSQWMTLVSDCIVKCLA